MVLVMTQLIRRMVTASLAAATVILACHAIGCIGSSESACRPGEICECDGIGSCVNDCAGGDCNFVCEGVGSCELSCPEGGCDAYCKGEGSCTLSCPGGDCLMVCSGVGSCEITDCDDGSCSIR